MSTDMRTAVIKTKKNNFSLVRRKNNKAKQQPALSLGNSISLACNPQPRSLSVKTSSSSGGKITGISVEIKVNIKQCE